MNTKHVFYLFELEEEAKERYDIQNESVHQFNAVPIDGKGYVNYGINARAERFSNATCEA